MDATGGLNGVATLTFNARGLLTLGNPGTKRLTGGAPGLDIDGVIGQAGERQDFTEAEYTVADAFVKP